MDQETIALDDDGEVWLLRLDRPEKRNAINLRMVEEIGAVLGRLEAGAPCRALVITGRGERAFAAGADIAELLDRRRDDAFRAINTGLFRRLEQVPCPTIAAIRGYALGGGCELALACDLRVAARSAKLGQPEVGLGIIPGAGATYRLPRLVGFGKARELIFTGRIVEAEEAHRIGLVDRLVDDGDEIEAACALAREIAAQDPLAVRLAKGMLLAAARGADLQSMEMASQAILFESEGKRERMQAFLDRRRARREARAAG